MNPQQQMNSQQNGFVAPAQGMRMPQQQMQQMYQQPVQGQQMTPQMQQQMQQQMMQQRAMQQQMQMQGQPQMQQQMNPQMAQQQLTQQQMLQQQQAAMIQQQRMNAMQPQMILPNQAPRQNPNAAALGAAAVNAKQTTPVSPNQDSPNSTQSTLLISEIRDNVVIMKDGSFRAVVACKSINFDLMSDMERESVEYSYQNFLNSLKFTTQILIRSQRVDIGPYIEKLNAIRRNNDNMLLGVLMDDYIDFIDVLSQEANIMDKSFFIIIPYYTSADAEKLVEQTKNIFKSFSRSKNTPTVTSIDRATYDKALTELSNRVDSVISGLFQIGIHSIRLNTRELGELYYNFNNPDTAVREPLVDFTKVATLYVKKGDKPQNG